MFVIRECLWHQRELGSISIFNKIANIINFNLNIWNKNLYLENDSICKGRIIIFVTYILLFSVFSEKFWCFIMPM